MRADRVRALYDAAMVRTLAAAIGFGALIAGCVYDWRREVARTAAFEHECTRERVRIVSDDGNPMARAVQLDVCGERRVYRDLGGRSAYVWVDTTTSLATDSGGERRAERTADTPRRRAPTLAPWSDDDIGGFLRAVNDGVVQCMSGAELSARLTLSRAGLVTDFTDQSPTPTAPQLSCIRRVFADHPLTGDGDARRVSVRFFIAEEPAPDDVPFVVSPSSPSFAEMVRARLTDRSGAILACIGADDAAVQVTWDAAGLVTFAVRGESDAAVVDCVTTAAGAMHPPSGTPAGRLIHPFSR